MMKILKWNKSGKYWLDSLGSTTNTLEKAKRFSAAEVLHLISTPTIRKNVTIISIKDL